MASESGGSRDVVADCIGADPREIIWTSRATESDNLAIRGTVEAMRESTGRTKIITMESEHKDVIDTCSHLDDVDVVVLKPKPSGVVCLDTLAKVLDENTLLVSIMLVNNETGVVQPIQTIARLAHEVDAFVHSDLAQAMGEVPWTVDQLGGDLVRCRHTKFMDPKELAPYVRLAVAKLLSNNMVESTSEECGPGLCHHTKSWGWQRPTGWRIKKGTLKSSV